MSNEKNTAVVTVLGRDRVGIIADVSRLHPAVRISLPDIRALFPCSHAPYRA